VMIWKEAEQKQRQIVSWRRQLHQIPEVGLELPRTKAALCGMLEQMGVSYRCYESCSAIEVLLQGGRPGKTVALRCDMDALPIREQTGLPFAAKNGAMHACGHDAHMAMMLGAIAVLNEHRSELCGAVKCLFQPGEEGCHGARRMIGEGALESPHVDAMIGLHVTPGIPELEPGMIGYRSGVLMAGSDAFAITVTGKGGHISNTTDVINPFSAAARLALAIQDKRQTLIDGREKAVIAVAAIHGGGKDNVVPDQAMLSGSIRTMDPEARIQLRQWLADTVERIAEEENCACSLCYTDTTGIVTNDAELTALTADALHAMLPEIKAVEMTTEVMASEDISDFFEICSGTYLHLGCGHAGASEDYPLHNARFRLNESVLWHGSAALIQAATAVLNTQR